MVDMVKISNEIFGESCLISCEEILYSFQIRYRIAASALPSAEKLVDLCRECLERDDMRIQFRSVEKFSILNEGSSVWISAYDDYKSQLEQDDNVNVELSRKV